MCDVRKCCFILLLMVIASTTFAIGYPIRYLGIEDGLSNNAVTSVYQDHKGFMWFGTYDGLNRYDGYRFKIYRNKVGDSTSLADNGIYTLADDSHHQLWVGGRRGVSVFNPATEKFTMPVYRPVNSRTLRKANENIHVIKSDENGLTLIGTEKNGLLVFDNTLHEGRQVPLPSDGTTLTNYEVTGIKLTGKSAWVFVQNIGLCRYEASQQTLHIISREIPRANCLNVDQSGNLLLGTDTGVFRYIPATGKFSGNALPENSKIVVLYTDRMGLTWCASDGNGIYLISGADVPARPFTHPGSPAQLSSNSVYSIYEDREGRKWIGTLRGGINILESRRNPFELNVLNRNPDARAIDNFIFSFCEEDAKNIWIGTDGGGLKYWNRETGAITSYSHDAQQPQSISSNFITSIIHDVRHDLWISTWFGGVNRYRTATGKFEHYVCFNPYTHTAENNVWLVYEDRQQQLWASTTNNGTLYRFSPRENQFVLFDSSLVNMQCLAEDREGQLWGGNYSSLIRIDSTHRQHRRFDIGYTVRSIHHDKRGNFWVGTDGGGLLRFNRQTGAYTRYTMTEGLPSNSILRMLEDNSGNIWISTFNGLSKFDPVKKTFRNFAASDGLQSNQFSFNAALALHSGEFAFGGIKGFNIFYPDSVYAETAIPPVWLTDIKINNTPVTALDNYVSGRTRADEVREITVPYDKATIAFDFVALEYSLPDKISYAYRLQGWDNNWNYVGSTRTANYTHLQEGQYTFEIKASNADGFWSPEIRTISLVVLPPWYRTWWAYLLYITTTLAAIYLYIQYKAREERLKYEIKLAYLEKEKEKELNEKKLSFFTNISHEFRTPLTLIINPLKELLQHKNDRDLGVVYRNARRLLSLVDQLLLFRKADQEGDQLKVAPLDIVNLCHEVYLCFSQQAKIKNIQYIFQAQPPAIEVYGDSEKLEISIFNLLSNAFKFTPDNGTIIFEVSGEEDGVTIVIKDSGCGIDDSVGNRIFEKFQRAQDRKESLQTGFGIGLYLVKHFIEKHHGSISYESKVNEGTAFRLSLKKGSAHFAGTLLLESAGHKSAFLEELSSGATLAAPDTTVAAQDAEVATTTITEKKSILLIDDHDEIRQYLQQLFKDKFVVYEADNGTTGFSAVQKYMPDLVISDIQMEGMDGVELCARIKQTDTISHIPVILLTGSSASDTRLKGLEGGADDYITKPFDNDLLMAKVNNIIKNRNLLQQYFFDRITLKNSNIKVPAEYQDFLKRCIEIIEANLEDETFSIKKFTLEIGMSHSSLYKKVKSISGQTINSFIRSIRLRKAAVFLLKENYTITQAAMQVGIGDIKYFREQFVKLFGMNPSDYVKKYRHSFNRDFNVTESQEEV
ncbi:two-component regulator propeller domain-containing protein [Chitinophaga eiseniae]|uniref:histidine kinase n=1 Tax=Chitinophaga eiseniae TaxID=634771 RepID=A0A847SQJ4_9BACT|nr:two-component regulator propeller domain-containing protein [Chitinophaga eiseniae]NLR79569.1 response regulator [Chitinophaga eiseniae]